VVEAEASPLQAAVMELYEGRETWNLADLALRLGMGDMTVMRNAMVFWGNLGVLKEGSKGDWILLERAEAIETGA
jgi:anaphase-promoting complex subunit 2